MKLVLVPLKKELDSLVSVLNGAEKTKNGFSYKDFQFVVGGLGKVNFAVSTMKYINKYKPMEVFAVGSCGALSKLDLLELVVVNKVLEYDFCSSFFPTPELNVDSKSFLNLKRVVCASGDKDVITNQDKAALFEKISADVVTWETAGFFKAMRSFKIPFTEIRVVTDFADVEAEKDFKKNLSMGMQKLGGLFKAL